MWWTVFDVTSKEKELQELEDAAKVPGFWDDNKGAAKVGQRISELKEIIERMELLTKEILYLKELNGLAKDEESMGHELWHKLNELKHNLE